MPVLNFFVQCYLKITCLFFPRSQRGYRHKGDIGTPYRCGGCSGRFAMPCCASCWCSAEVFPITPGFSLHFLSVDNLPPLGVVRGSSPGFLNTEAPPRGEGAPAFLPSQNQPTSLGPGSSWGWILLPPLGSFTNDLVHPP